MARWRLMTPHYLKVPDNYWEQIETDQKTGKRLRKLHNVPLLLDPKEQGDWNYPGEIVVCHEGKGLPRDQVFFGPPTPDMEPMDEEAQAISKAESPKWAHPIDTLAAQGGQDYGAQLLEMFSRQLDAAINKAGGIPKLEANVSVPNNDALAQLQAQMNELMEKNAILERKVAQMEHADDDVDLNAVPPPPETLADKAQAAARRV